VRSRRGPYCTEDGKDNITLPEGRDPTSTELSEAVSEGACPIGPITPNGKKSREGQRRLYRRAKQRKRVRLA
jgi:topoisomerase IA-like protein